MCLTGCMKKNDSDIASITFFKDSIFRNDEIKNSPGNYYNLHSNTFHTTNKSLQVLLQSSTHIVAHFVSFFKYPEGSSIFLFTKKHFI